MTGRALPLVGEDHHRTKGLVRLTMACNERCPFCNVPVEDYRPATPPAATVARELDELIAAGERTLTISGGEPTLLRERLIELVREARGRGVPFVELQTNAILIDEGYARELAEAGLTSAFVSLLSDLPELHDELAGYPGAFEPCLRGIDALLDAGVCVALNPVIAHRTQARVAAYVDFVALRLPRVGSISLSAVQPHGRAAHSLDLLPDYAVLGPEVRRARERARLQGIRMLNPYCGLPLCVGWQDAPDSSVDVVEAGEHAAFGLDNSGNKRHGPPCRACAWRTRCAGAWHAYWDVRGGSGIAPASPRIEPWTAAADDAPHQRVIRARRLDEASWSGGPTPTTWLCVGVLRAGDARTLLAGPCRDVALLCDAGELVQGELGAELRVIAEHNARADERAAVRVVVGLRRLGSFKAAFEAMRFAAEHGVEAVRLLSPRDARLGRLVGAARRELGLDITMIEAA